MAGAAQSSWLGPVRVAAVAAALCLAPGAAFGDTGLDDPPEETLIPAPDVDAAEPPAVEALLDQLAEASEEREAQRLERMIVQAWRQSGSPTVDLLAQRAGEAMEERAYGVALELLDRVVELAPEFAEGWNMRATVHYRINEYQRSIDDIGRALALQPRHFGALGGLGMIFNELDDKPRALSALRRALRIHPYLSNVRPLVERLEIEVEGREI